MGDAFNASPFELGQVVDTPPRSTAKPSVAAKPAGLTVKTNGHQKTPSSTSNKSSSSVASAGSAKTESAPKPAEDSAEKLELQKKLAEAETSLEVRKNTSAEYRYRSELGSNVCWAPLGQCVCGCLRGQGSLRRRAIVVWGVRTVFPCNGLFVPAAQSSLCVIALAAPLQEEERTLAKLREQVFEQERKVNQTQATVRSLKAQVLRA